MSLANLTINVIANTGAAQAGLRNVGDTAQEQFMRSGAAVDDFRKNLMQAASSLDRAAKQMGGSMQAANDAIVTSTAQSEAAIEQLADTANKAEFVGFGERAAAAFGTAFGAGYAVAQTWLQKTEDYVVAKGKAIAIGMAIVAVSATAGAVYAAYKIISGTLGFINGLFTGESYKAASIDELVALNNQVKDLQKNLNISAQEAGALLDATSRLGVNKDDYTAAYKGAAAAMRTNGDELDRLGVQYKDQNGKLLETEAFLTNVKAALDQYTAGYDRNAAAASIGAGSYEQVAAALAVSQQELEKSKARLDEYQVAIGPNTQAAVALYEQAMRDFNNETKLTGQGVSRAIADAIMPALTDLANFFKDGWPRVVGAVRIGTSTMVGLFYALKNGVYITAESILGSVQSIGLAVGGVGAAFAKIMTGDFSGAKAALLDGLEDAKTRFMQIGTNIVAQVMHNDAAIRLAVGDDDRKQSLADAAAGRKAKPGKAWVPKPAAASPAPAAPASSAYQTYINELDRTLTKLQENEYASMRLKAQQLAQKEGITDLAGAYQRINAIQRQESQRVVDDMVRKLGDETAAYAFQTSIMGQSALQQDKLSFAMQKRLDLEQLIASAKKSSKPLDEQAIADLQSQTAATIALGLAQRDQRDAIARSAATGTDTALRNYQDAAGNAAKMAEGLVTGSLQRMEDALVKFAKTGKLNFSDLFSFMAEEFIRQQARMLIAKASAGFSSGGFMGAISAIGSFFGGGDAGVTGATGDFARADRSMDIIPGHAAGLPYVPHDNYLARLHKGERVMTAANATDSRQDAAALTFTQTNYIGSNISASDVARAMQQAKAEAVSAIYQSMRRGGLMASA